VNQAVIDKLKALGACSGTVGAVPWVAQQKTPRQAWRDCKRGDWMLWILGRMSGPPESESRRRLVLAACDCAELSLPYVTDDWVRSICEATLEVTRAWAVGADATIEQVREERVACWRAASAAAYAAYAAHAAAYAAYDAAYADDAAHAAAYAASAASADDAAHAAAYAASAAASADYAAEARTRILAECADIVREWYPEPPRLEEVKR
jgi:hypothetical protein